MAPDDLQLADYTLTSGCGCEWVGGYVRELRLIPTRPTGIQIVPRQETCSQNHF